MLLLNANILCLSAIYSADGHCVADCSLGRYTLAFVFKQGKTGSGGGYIISSLFVVEGSYGLCR